MTPKQLETLDLIKTHINTHGVPPTLNEMGKMLGITRDAALDRLNGLVRRGVITRKRYATRGIELVAPHLSEESIKTLAARIAKDLFEAGNGERAERLKLFAENDRDLGGWSEPAAAARIALLLAEAKA